MSRKWFYQGGPNLPDTTLNRRIFSWILFSPPPGDLLSEWPGHGPPPQASPGSPSPHRPPPPSGRQPAAVTHRHLVASNQASTGLKWHQLLLDKTWHRPFASFCEFRQRPTLSLQSGVLAGIAVWHVEWSERLLSEWDRPSSLGNQPASQISSLFNWKSVLTLIG